MTAEERRNKIFALVKELHKTLEDMGFVSLFTNTVYDHRFGKDNIEVILELNYLPYYNVNDFDHKIMVFRNDTRKGLIIRLDLRKNMKQKMLEALMQLKLIGE